jgi:hypothetical protein
MDARSPRLTATFPGPPRSVSPTLLRSVRHAGSAATVRAQRKTSNFTRRQRDVSEPRARDGLPAFLFEFRPFVVAGCGALGTSAKQEYQSLAQRYNEGWSMTVATCKRRALLTISVALHWALRSTNARENRPRLTPSAAEAQASNAIRTDSRLGTAERRIRI